MTKSPDAFRTISEVADWLDRPAHVLRFWESKFTQVKPIKRAGGRRYYRPQDMLLLGGIKKLLHDDGLTIKGVQKMLRDRGVEHVSSLSQPLDEVTETGALVPSPEKVAALKAAAPVPESAQLLQFRRQTDDAEDELASTDFDGALDEYHATDDLPAEEPAAPEAPEQSAPTAAPQPAANEAFDAPNFFSMFDQVEPEAEPNTVAETEPDMAPEPEPDAIPEPEQAEPAAATIETPVEDVPAPRQPDVPVDATSDAGPGPLSRLRAVRATGWTGETGALEDLRDQFRTLRQRLLAD
ncbi:MerR family transcriptional regulator [Thalassobius vesicularis]|uniref:MerR family transcriptional regulator n=1 Tax=Thalassobius vesicularis TaxID=1294297 RepID=UPI001FE67B83|nr:MerR family transcriptional regulator [Thalassobius vesicularis]